MNKPITDEELLNRWSENDLSDLLDCIRGVGRWRFKGVGITTYPTRGPEERCKYVACCELERRGCVTRRSLNDGIVLFVNNPSGDPIQQCEHCDGQGGWGSGYQPSEPKTIDNLPSTCGYCDGKGRVNKSGKPK